MDHRRIDQSKAGGVLVIVAIALVVLTGTLAAHVYVSRMLEYVVPGSADIVIAVIVLIINLISGRRAV